MATWARTRRLHSSVLVAVLLVSAVPGIGAARAATTHEVPESPDYAGQVLHDPWDYSQATDLMVDQGGVTSRVRDMTHLDDGTVEWVAAPQGQPWHWYVTPMWMTWPHPGDDPGALNDARDGLTKPLDADRFTHLSMSVFVEPGPVTGRITWFGCHEYEPRCEGGMEFPLDTGWNTVVLPLRNNVAGLPLEWQGDVLGLRFTASNGHDVRFRLNWLRIHEPGEQITVPASYGDLYWSSERTRCLDYDESVQCGRLPSGTTVDAGLFPPGRYHIYEEGTHLDTVVVEPLPRPRILDPDRAGGADFATEMLGDPWDFSDPADTVAIRNATDVSWSGGVLAATNASNDPYVQLPVGADGLDPVHYHRVTVRTWYDGPFELDDRPGVGGGTHGRLVWRTNGHPLTGATAYSDGREMVFFTDRRTFTYDMHDVGWDPVFRSTAEPNVDPQSRPFAPPDPTWRGSTIRYLRFDPNEAPNAYRWYLDDLRIAADDAASPTFDIAWENRAHETGTVVEVGLDTDRSGFDGEILASQTEQPGRNVVRFDAADRLPGTYWVHVTSRTPDGRESRTYADGPLQVSPRIAGDDRIGTAIELSRQSFDAAGRVVLASSTNFPDALAAVQLADAVGGPLLLTPPDRLDSRVADELQRLATRQVFVAGGPGAVSPQVVTDLKRRGVVVERVGGQDRYETAVRLARAATTNWGQTGRPDRVVLATGTNFPDALAAGPLVGAGDVPLLLTHPDTPAPVVRDAIAELAPREVIVLGGPAAVSDRVLARQLAGTPYRRLSGPDRFATAAAVAREAVRAGADPGDVLIATGLDYPDALAAGPAAIARGGVLVLTARDRAPQQTRDVLRQQSGAWSSWRVVGGPRAVLHVAVRDLRSASGLG